MATERLEPDVLITLTNMTGVVGDIQADPDTKSGSWTATDPLRATGNNTNVTAHCSFPTPTGDLTVGAGLQEFRVLLRPFDAGQTSDPNWRIELWQAGVLIRAGSNTSILNDAGDTVVAFPWNGNELTLIDGSAVEIKVFGIKTGGSGSKRNTIDFGAIEWNVTYDASGTTFFEAPAMTAVGTMGRTQVATHSRTLANNATGTVGLSRISLFFRTLANTAIGTAAVSKKLFMSLVHTATGTLTFAKGLLFSMAGNTTALGTAGFTRVFVAVQASMYTATGTPSFSRVATFIRGFSYTATPTPVLVKGMFKSFVYTASGALNTMIAFLKIINKSINASATVGFAKTFIAFVEGATEYIRAKANFFLGLL